MSNISYIYCVSFFVLLYWNTILIIQLNGKNYFMNSFYNACYLIKMQPSPIFTVLTYKSQDMFTSVNYDVNLSNCNDYNAYKEWKFRERPIVGDHIHIGMVLSVDNFIYNFHDRNMSQPIYYEKDNYTTSCPNPGSFAYEKRWYHTGVHTHCDGNIIHVHPWSAPDQLRVEGRKVRLKMWFESVGIEVSTDKMALKLPGHDTYLYDWNMEYYVNVNDQKASFRTSSVEEMINLWLVDHHGEIILWNGGSRPDKDYRVVAYKKHPSNYPKRYI
jgi:hypothetical protein